MVSNPCHQRGCNMVVLDAYLGFDPVARARSQPPWPTTRIHPSRFRLGGALSRCCAYVRNRLRGSWGWEHTTGGGLAQGLRSLKGRRVVWGLGVNSGREVEPRPPLQAESGPACGTASARCSTELRSAARQCARRPGSSRQWVRGGEARSGVVRCSEVRCGVVWCSEVWCAAVGVVR